MSNNELRDDRVKGWFWAEDKLFDEYAPEIGVYGVAVYCLLCRMSDGKGVSWPSYSYIAKKLKMSRRTVMRTIEVLVDAGLINVTVRTDTSAGGKDIHKSHQYTLKNLSQGGDSDAPPSDSDAPRVVTQMHQGGDSGELEGQHIEGQHIEGRGNTSKNGHVHYLDKETQQIVWTLQSIEGWNKNEAKTLELVSLAKSAYPKVDLAQLATTFSFKIRTGAVKKYRYPAKAFSNWIASQSTPPKNEPSYMDLPEL